ncbi:Cro/CI family transcriptional regulator [Aeromonas veronii]|uniref:Cro/CI family transcriptional regulator n=1 Tax=Aeromonas veronii TaxID=654 RepID=UPI0030060FE6
MKKTDALNHFGGVTKTAIALGINKATVSCWGETIPQGRAYQIESLTGGKLKVNQADYATPTNPSEVPQAPALEQ